MNKRGLIVLVSCILFSNIFGIEERRKGTHTWQKSNVEILQSQFDSLSSDSADSDSGYGYIGVPNKYREIRAFRFRGKFESLFGWADSLHYYVVKDLNLVDNIRFFGSLKTALSNANTKATASSPILIEIEEGTFAVDTTLVINNSNVYISGQVTGSTVLNYGTYSGTAFTIAENKTGYFRDLRIRGSNLTYGFRYGGTWITALSLNYVTVDTVSERGIDISVTGLADLRNTTINKAGNNGVVVGSGEVYLENVKVKRAGYSGFSLGDAYGVIRSCVSRNCDFYGIEMGNDTLYRRIEDCDFEGKQQGMRLRGRVDVYSSTAKAYAKIDGYGSGFAVADAGGTPSIHRIKFEGCIFNLPDTVGAFYWGPFEISNCLIKQDSGFVGYNYLLDMAEVDGWKIYNTVIDGGGYLQAHAKDLIIENSYIRSRSHSAVIQVPNYNECKFKFSNTTFDANPGGANGVLVAGQGSKYFAETVLRNCNLINRNAGGVLIYFDGAAGYSNGDTNRVRVELNECYGSVSKGYLINANSTYNLGRDTLVAVFNGGSYVWGDTCSSWGSPWARDSVDSIEFNNISFKYNKEGRTVRGGISDSSNLTSFGTNGYILTTNGSGDVAWKRYETDTLWIKNGHLVVTGGDMVEIGDSIVTAKRLAVGLGLVSPTSTFQTASFSVACTTATSAVTLGVSHNAVFCNGTLTVTLPLASTCKGRRYDIKNIGTGTVTVARSGTDLIDNATSLTISPGNSYTLISDGVSNWWTQGGGGGGGTPATSVVSEMGVRDSIVGTSTDYARADHSHGTYLNKNYFMGDACECWQIESPWFPSTIASGTQLQVVGEANHPGIVQFRSSTSANSGITVCLDQYYCTFLFAGSEGTEFIFKPLKTAEVYSRMGFQDNWGTTLPTDGAYFNIRQDSLEGATANFGSSSYTASRYLMSTNTWYYAKLLVNSNATQVNYWLYSETGTLLWSDSLTTNIPTAVNRETGHGLTIYEVNTALTVDNLMNLDFLNVYINRRLVR